jgi:hypothetical protein
VLLAAFFGLVLYQGIATDILWFGLALLTLGCIVSTYLGLLVTRGLGWLESALCIATMTALTLASLTVMRGEFVAATQWMLGLAGLAVAYRLMARARWRELDWMLARSA